MTIKLLADRQLTLLWIGTVIVALALEVAILRSTAERQIAPYLPLWADQVQYLNEAYRGYELMREHGVFAGTIEAVRLPRVQGWLLQTVASWSMLIVGPSRIAALDVNFALLVIWLGTTSYVVKRSFGVIASLIALGLFLLAATLLANPGGPFDFRLDFAAMCLWGTIIAVIAASPGLEGWRTRLAVFVLGLALIAARLISASYLLPFSALLVLAYVPMQRLTGRPWRRGLIWLVLTVAAWTIVLGLIVWSTFDLFSSYYLRGHIMAGESTVRRLATGLNTLRDDLVYYPWVLHQDHLGRLFEYLSVATLILALAAGLFLRRAGGTTARHPEQDRPEPTHGHRVAWFLLVSALSLVATFATLATAQVKSTAVAGVLVPSIVLLLVGVTVWLARGGLSFRPVLALGLLGPVLIGAGLVVQWQRIGAGLPYLPPRPVLTSNARLVDDALPYVTQPRDRPIIWSLDTLRVELSGPTIQVFVYERTGQWIRLGGAIGYGPIEQRLDEAAILRGAEASDVLILSKPPPGTTQPYPYFQSIHEQHEVLERYAAERLSLIGTYDVQAEQLFLYVRQNAP